MLRPDIIPAYVPAQMRGDSSASWLVGIHSGQPVIILGGAPGLDAHPELPLIAGRPVIGTNWTLELLTPTYLQIVDASVWNHQASKITASQTIILATQGIFGGGSYYSAKSPNVARFVGGEVPLKVFFKIKMSQGGYRDPNTGFFHRPMAEPYLCSDPTQPFYFGGNSLCYALQWAHIMGASMALLMGFTLKSGSGYFFLPNGQKPTKSSGIYEMDRARGFLSVLEAQKPGWAKVVDGWEGPVYDLLPRTSLAMALGVAQRADRADHTGEVRSKPKLPW